jgi:hypothetical protein
MKEADMPKYVIEREIPGAGALTSDEVRAISGKSNAVVAELGPRVKWLHSYITTDKVYCVFVADDEAAVREHAECAGFPANLVSRVATVADPATGE